MKTVICSQKDEGPNGVISGTKRMKLSKKLLNGCNVTGKTSVPRKLRTAMKKRSCESPSPTLADLKKLSHSTRENESQKQNGVKKFKKDVILNWSPRKSLSGPMTKDEEEVAEVLFAMAGMLPDKETSHDDSFMHGSAPTEKSVLLEAMECLIPAQEGIRLESDLGSHSLTNEAVCTSVSEGKHAVETKEVINSDESVINRPNLLDRHLYEDSTKDKELCIGIWSRMKLKNSKATISCNVGFNSELRIDFGLEQGKEQMQALSSVTPEFNDELASHGGSQLLYPSIFKESCYKAPPPWPLSLSMVSNGSTDPQKTSIAKMPAWIDATLHSRKPTSIGLSHSKASKNTVDRIQWKRCATHVWIGHLIQELKGRDSKDSVSMLQMHIKQEKDANREFQMQASLHRLRSCHSNGVTLANTIELKDEQKCDQVKSGTPPLVRLKERPLHNQSSGVYKPEKQGFDFLSLSTGDSGVDLNTMGSRTRAGNVSGMWSYLSLGPINVQGAHQSIPTLNNYYSPAYGNQISAGGLQQVRLQFPAHLGDSSSSLVQKGPCILTKEQQQQQMLWAAMAHRQGLQATKLNHQTVTLPLVPPLPDTRCPRYTMKVSQHHQLASLPLASVPSPGLKRQQDHRPSAGVRSYSGALPLQLLCNERL